MTRALSRLTVPVALAVVLAVVFVAFPGRVDPAIRVFFLLLAAFAVAQLLARLRASLPARGISPVDAALDQAPRKPARVPELERIEREVSFGLTNAFDLHYRLRPVLRRIASELLRARRGIDLDTDPEAARHALGEETWELVRPDREPPEQRFGRGLELASLRTVVGSLEAL